MGLFSGIVTRIKGKTEAGLGIFGRVFVGFSNADLPVGTNGYGIFACNGAPTNGTSGTYANNAPKGSLLVRVDSAAFYQNTGTLSSPTWTAAPLTGVAGITSGTINGATVGATTPAAGTFTTLTATGLTTLSAEDGVTASTTQTLVGGTALTKTFEEISTVANAGDAVTLAALSPGEFQVVFNAGAHAASVFPHATGVAIDGGSAGAAVTLTNAKRAIFLCIATNKIISAQLGVVSA